MKTFHSKYGHFLRSVWSQSIKHTNNTSVFANASQQRLFSTMGKYLSDDQQKSEQKNENIDKPYEVFKSLHKASNESFDLEEQRKSYRNQRIDEHLEKIRSQPFQLKKKKPSESIITIPLPFSKDHKLREAYLNNFGGIRMGRLLEDLDSLAGEVAYRHSDGFHPDRPVTIVTASVDRIELSEPIIPYFDLQLQGFVTWVGRSSMEVRMEISSLIDGKIKRVMVALFTMVARERYTNKAAPVHGIEVTNQREEELYEMAVEKQEARKRMAERSLTRQPPTESEKILLHNIFLKLKEKKSSQHDWHQWFESGAHIKPEATIKSIYGEDYPTGKERFMSSTIVRSTKLMHPQQRNIHNKIFGGYLLRQAYELAWVCASIFSKGRPVFHGLDDNSFLKPVEIGSILNLSATVVFTTKNTCHVQVEAEVIHPQLGTSEITNIFNFSFMVNINTAVLPTTYEEAMMFLEGKRVHEKGQELAIRLQQGRGVMLSHH